MDNYKKFEKLKELDKKISELDQSLRIAVCKGEKVIGISIHTVDKDGNEQIENVLHEFPDNPRIYNKFVIDTIVDGIAGRLVKETDKLRKEFESL